MLAKPSDGRRDLDHWAQEIGYSSFDTYLAVGGRLSAARSDLERRAHRITSAVAELQRYAEQPDPVVPVPAAHSGTIGPEALARLEAERADGELGDTANAQVQGAEHE